MDAIRETIFRVLQEDHPQTVRQVFYRLTSEGVIGKTEQEYKGTVTRLLAEMRRDGTIPYRWLADSTRWQRRPKTYSSIEEALERVAATYRRGLWVNAADQVEIWLEKDALAGVLVEVTDPWDVPLMVCKGYPSMSFTHSAAEAIGSRLLENGQRTVIYYFGDHDPSGLDIDRVIVNQISEALRAMYVWSDYPEGDPDEIAAFSHFAGFERVAVNLEQIDSLQLQTRPTKRSDTRSKNFKGESVEVDAIPSQVLRGIANESIERHVDRHQLDVLEKVEVQERKGLEAIARSLEPGEGS